MKCPYCGEDKLKDLKESGLLCEACDRRIPRIPRPNKKINIFGLSVTIIHCVIVSVYFIILYYILFFILKTVLVDGSTLEIAFLVFYSIIVLAFVDLTSLVFEQHLFPVYRYFHSPYEFWASPYEREVNANKYINRITSIGAIIILMHIFYRMVAIEEVTTAEAVIIGLSLFGVATILIACGIWRKLQLEVIEKLYRK